MQARKHHKPRRRKSKKGWQGKEVFRVKEYKSLGTFYNAVRRTVRSVMGGEDILWIVVSPWDAEHRGYRKNDYGDGDWDSTIFSVSKSTLKEWKKRLDKGEDIDTIGDLIRNFGEVSYAEGGKNWKRGLDVDFDAGRIYVYDLWKE